MLTTLTQICEYLRNWFTASEDKHEYRGEVIGGVIVLPYLLDGEYFRIFGSRLNDGVYRYPVTGLKAEELDCEIWRMRIPQDVLGLVDEISAYNADTANAPSAYTSESFGGYSYTKGRSGDGVSAYSWQDAFRSRLNRWRKVDFCE